MAAAGIVVPRLGGLKGKKLRTHALTGRMDAEG